MGREEGLEQTVSHRFGYPCALILDAELYLGVESLGAQGHATRKGRSLQGVEHQVQQNLAQGIFIDCDVVGRKVDLGRKLYVAFRRPLFEQTE